VVNTTARLQTAAPVNGILVGEATRRATAGVISYRRAPPVMAKGKAEPVPGWEAVEARSRFGIDLPTTSRAPLVGRLHESRVLDEALERAQREHSPQLVTLVGVPGIGKSRLVAELFQRVDNDPSQVVTWRQGRSLPYGDGVTFWALAEMVKAQAGILETDREEDAEEKLREAVASLIADPGDAQWISGHLRPLAGVSTASAPAGDRREEAFTAWRRFFEALAEQNPLVLVFEDLHWADDNLLDFVEHLVDWAGAVPMLVVCATRPELLERRPGWAGATRNATKLSLAPLSDDETSKLISNLSDRPVMPLERQQALLARAGGNPLYAEQYVRMLSERSHAEELPLPETVQGIIAARLDALSPEEKALLQDAAVLGKVFWLGAVTSGLDRRTAEIGSTRWSARTSCNGRGGHQWRARPSTRSCTSSSVTSRTGRSPERGAAKSTDAQPSGSHRSAGRRITRRCSLTITPTHWNFGARPANRSRRHLPLVPWKACVTRASARSHSTRT
jgi:hypothetical protein